MGARASSQRLWALACIALIGLNLRPFLTAPGPLAGPMRGELGLNFQTLSLLTLVPVALMGLCAFAGPALQARLGARGVIVGALAALGFGCFLRLFARDSAMLLATATLCGLGVAAIQAVLPSIIKRHFPDRAAAVSGLYSAMLMTGGALGAAAAPAIAQAAGGGWRLGLAWLAAPAAAAALVCAMALPREARSRAAAPDVGAMLRRPRTWLLMAAFGLMNGGYSSAVAWLSPAYQDKGWNGQASGGLLATMAAGQAVAALALPALADRRQDRRLWLGLTLATQTIGFVGLALWPLAAPVVWVLLTGAGLGGCFALLLGVALDHRSDPLEAGALSAVMQGGGFLLAAIPPWIVAQLRETTGSFAAGWLAHAGCTLVVALLVARLAPAGYARAMEAKPARNAIRTSAGASQAAIGFAPDATASEQG